jgi:4a-hydroxytetrahydrobiopterin dehydratase
MDSIEKLSEEQLETGLAGLPEWTQNGDAIQRTFGFDDFVQAMSFVSRVAERAEAVQHHPDILVRYSKVTLTLSTHDANGISEKDLAFAGDCDGLLTS